MLKNNEKKNETVNQQNNLEEVKTNLFNKATENKNKEQNTEEKMEN